jgi:hypothetical protein
MKKPKNIPTYYKSAGTPIYRDTTALPFAAGGSLNNPPKTEYYTYGDTKNKYKKIGNQWYISNDVTDFKFQPIQDPTGNRTKELNKNAKIDKMAWIPKPGIERTINSRLNDAMGRAGRAGEFHAPKGEDNVDNIRHANAGYHTAKAIADATGSPTLGYIGSLLLGAAHEAANFENSSQSYDDMSNNTRGAELVYNNKSDKENLKHIKYLSDTYQMPMGYGTRSPFPGSSFVDPYYLDQELQAQKELLANPNPKPVSLTEKFADGGPLHDRDINGKLLQSTYASALGNMFREGGPFGEDQGVFDYATSIYASQPGNYYAQGGMIKRADGSYSPRGLWDNIRAKAASNKRAGKEGKEPSEEMLAQGRKIAREYRTGGQFPRPYSLPEDSFKQGGTNLHNSVYASSSAPYPGIYAEGGALLPPDNAPAGTPFNLANRNSWMGDYSMIPQGHNLSLPLTSLPGIGNQITSGAATANFKTVGDYVTAAENWERNQAGSPIAPGPVNINTVIPSTPPIPEVAKTNYYTDPYTGQVVKDFNPVTGVATPREIPNSFGNTQYSSYLEKVANSPAAKENQQALEAERLNNMELLKTMTPEQKAAMRAAGLTPVQYLADPFSAGATKFAKGGKLVVAGGEKHKIYKKTSPTGNGEGMEGHIIVNHPTMDKGQWDTIDLTTKAGAKTVADGIAATKQWHKENPNQYAEGGMLGGPGDPVKPKPIYVTNPNDPRLLAHNDSLSRAQLSHHIMNYADALIAAKTQDQKKKVAQNYIQTRDKNRYSEKAEGAFKRHPDWKGKDISSKYKKSWYDFTTAKDDLRLDDAHAVPYKGSLFVGMDDYPSELFPFPKQKVILKKSKVEPTTVDWSKSHDFALSKSSYEKKYPPIYLSDPNDPRIDGYTEAGNQYLYKPVAPKTNPKLEILNLPTKKLPQIETQIIPNNYNYIPQKYKPIQVANRSQTIMEADPDREGKYRMKEMRQVPYSAYFPGEGWQPANAPRVLYIDSKGNEVEERPKELKQLDLQGVTFENGGSILSMSNTPQLEGEGKDLTYPDGAYVYNYGGKLFAPGGPIYPTNQQLAQFLNPEYQRVTQGQEVTVRPNAYQMQQAKNKAAGINKYDPLVDNKPQKSETTQKTAAYSKNVAEDQKRGAELRERAAKMMAAKDAQKTGVDYNTALESANKAVQSSNFNSGEYIQKEDAKNIGSGPASETVAKKSTAPQSYGSRAWDMITNPQVAFEYAVRTGDFRNMPHNYNDMLMAGIDPSAGKGANLVGDALNASTNLVDAGDKVVRNIGEGNYFTAAMQGLRFLPSNGLVGNVLGRERGLLGATKYYKPAAISKEEALANLANEYKVNRLFDAMEGATSFRGDLQSSKALPVNLFNNSIADVIKYKQLNNTIKKNIDPATGKLTSTFRFGDYGDLQNQWMSRVANEQGLPLNLSYENKIGEGSFGSVYPTTIDKNLLVKIGEEPKHETLESLQSLVDLGKQYQDKPHIALPLSVVKINNSARPELKTLKVMNRVPGEPGIPADPSREAIDRFISEVEDLQSKGVSYDFMNPENIMYDSATDKFSLIDLNTKHPDPDSYWSMNIGYTEPGAAKAVMQSKFPQAYPESFLNRGPIQDVSRGKIDWNAIGKNQNAGSKERFRAAVELREKLEDLRVRALENNVDPDLVNEAIKNGASIRSIEDAIHSGKLYNIKDTKDIDWKNLSAIQFKMGGQARVIKSSQLFNR